MEQHQGVGTPTPWARWARMVRVAAAGLALVVLLDACGAGVSAAPSPVSPAAASLATSPPAAPPVTPRFDAVSADVRRRLPAAVSQVAAIWGPAARRPVEVDTDAVAVAGAGGLAHAAAAFVGGPHPRLVVDPAAWEGLSATGRDVVLRHELTHLATAADAPFGRPADAAVPAWVLEGAAEWTAWRTVPWPARRIAPELTALVRSGHAPRALPGGHDLDPATEGSAAAYSSAWLAAGVIVRHAGAAGLVRLVAALERHPGDQNAALRGAAGLTAGDLEQEWRRSVATLG